MPTQGTLTLHIRDKAAGPSSRKSHDVDALCSTEFDGSTNVETIASRPLRVMQGA